VKKPARAGFFARARPLTNARVIACWFWPIADAADQLQTVALAITDGSSSNHNIHIDFEVQSAFSQSFHLF
jgi:hypothetical protein